MNFSRTRQKGGNPGPSRAQQNQLIGSRNREPKTGQPETQKSEKRNYKLYFSFHFLQEIPMFFIYFLSIECILLTSSDLGKEFPPIFYYERTKTFVQPKLLFLGSEKQSAFEIPNGETIDLFCAGGFKGYKDDKLKATCTSNNRFLVNGKKIDMKKLICNKRQEATAEITSKSCCQAGKFINIFFNVDDTKMTVYKSCHNEKTGQNYWTYHLMGPVNNAYQDNVEREVPFTQDRLYQGIDVDVAYRKTSQVRTFASILPGGESDAERIIVQNTNIYFARGHLMAKTDAVLENDQMATFKYANVMPQFQSFNKGNWLTVEKNLRGFLSLIHTDLNVYTGTHGVLSYDGVPLYLHVGGTDKRIPVPAIFYKIIVTKDNTAGIVIVGINDVHATAEGVKKFILCDDVIDQTNVIKISSNQQQDIGRGYIYACPVHAFVNHPNMKNEVPNIKNTDRIQILTKGNANGGQRK